MSIVGEDEVSFVSGILVSSPSRTSGGRYYSVKVKAWQCGNTKGLVSGAKGIFNAYIPASSVEAFFPGRLYSVSEAENVFETGSRVFLEGSFSEGSFFCKNAASYGFDKGFLSFFRKIRALGRLKFKRLLYKWGNAGGLLLALLSGAREYTELEVSENFKRAGLSHVLALSGMHLSLFSGLALFMGNTVNRKKLSLILQLCLVSLFVWFAGFSPSLLRAFICVFVLLFQMVINIERSEMLLVLCFSFFVQTVISPNDLTNTGFILSYGALCGILMTGEFLRKVLSVVFPKYFANGLSASISAQAITMPVSAKLFGQITPIGIISSVVVSPFVSLFIYSGLVLIVFGLLFPGTTDLSGIFMQIQYNFIRYLVGIFSKVPPIFI